MPLMKKSSMNERNGVEAKLSGETLGLAEPPLLGNDGTQIAEKPAKHTREMPMTKDDYWRRREERDIETGIRIRRSGVIQAAAMSMGTSQYNLGSTIDSYADVVEKLAERMLAWVQKD